MYSHVFYCYIFETKSLAEFTYPSWNEFDFYLLFQLFSYFDILVRNSCIKSQFVHFDILHLSASKIWHMYDDRIRYWRSSFWLDWENTFSNHYKCCFHVSYKTFLRILQMYKILNMSFTNGQSYCLVVLKTKLQRFAVTTENILGWWFFLLKISEHIMTQYILKLSCDLTSKLLLSVWF